MSRNPYTQNQTTQVRKSVCAYFDILGYKEIINQAYNEDETNTELDKLNDALQSSIKFLKDYQLELLKGTTKFKRTKIDKWAIKTFSDNFIMGFPLKDYDKVGWDNGKELFEIIDCIELFQMEMSLSGYCIRGCITIGELFIGDDIIFGKALLDAHNGEVNLAKVPRVILLKDAKKFARDGINSINNQNMGLDDINPSHNLKVDTDSQTFVNYLACSKFPLGGLTEVQKINKHKAVIEENLTKFNSFTKNWYKYYWLANYHNYYCDNNISGSNCKIDISLFIKQPYQFKDFN